MCSNSDALNVSWKWKAETVFELGGGGRKLCEALRSSSELSRPWPPPLVPWPKKKSVEMTSGGGTPARLTLA
jgi:hypothetical protein